MKKLQLLLMVLVLVAVSSCKKDSVPQQPAAPKYVKAIAGSFNVKDGDLTFKDAPVGQNRIWSMYAVKSTFYGDAAFSLVKGAEFITGSAAYNFWSLPANNPASFPAAQSVYSNLTPDEDVRLITETTDANGHVAYLGMLDFKPSQVSFPLVLHGCRLGDILQINTDAITSLPGGNNLTVSVAFNKAAVNLTATKVGIISGPNTGVPNGKEFTWSDIIYSASAAVTPIVVPKGSGNFTLYEGIDSKVMGDIVITITEANNGGSTIILPAIPAKGAGNGLKLTLTTTKKGWYDSQTVGFTDTDITVLAQDVPVN